MNVNTKVNKPSKNEVNLKKFFEPSYMNDYINNKEPTEEEIQAAFKFYE